MSAPGDQPPSAKGRGSLLHRLRSRDHGGPTPEASSPALEQEQLIVAALADLKTLDVREVMTPRLDVVALQLPVTAEAVAQAVRATGHRCFPVVTDELDDLVGVLYVTDLFRTNQAQGHEPSRLDISKRLRDAHVIPESLTVLEALADLRQARRRFAVVVDEFGGVAGVLTIKDLLEPLVGDLADEFDEAEEPPVIRVDRTRWLVDGRASLDEVRALGVEVADGEYVTFGGYLFELFGHIPEEQEVATVPGFEFKVAEMDKRRIAKVLVKQLTAPLAEAERPEGGSNGR